MTAPPTERAAPPGRAAKLARTALKLPVYLYRYIVSPVIGPRCRHLPTCSEYALEAIETNGAWKGGWLTLSRLVRCHPWGTDGFDPVPDLRGERHIFAPWRYGRWTRRQIEKESDKSIY
ncbi:MAG: membrane protein insertion efficiency factor YidD [Dichotomicrobium sp.]